MGVDDMYQKSIDDLSKKLPLLKDKNEKKALDKILNILERDKSKFHKTVIEP
jgi:hypothetical protein